MWYSKRQNTVGTSTFGSKFVAMRISVEIVEALRYKLRMYGMPIARRAKQCLLWQRGSYQEYFFPESTLKKKHNSIAYHRSREAVAARTIRVTKEDGKMTKPLAQATKDFLCDRFMYWDWTQPRFIKGHTKMLDYLLDMQDMWLWKPGHRFVASNISVSLHIARGEWTIKVGAKYVDIHSSTVQQWLVVVAGRHWR